MPPLDRTVLSHPGSAYVIVAFLALCVTAMVQIPLAALLYLLPVAAAGYIARTATIVDDTGLTARALLGSAQVQWAELSGLQLLPSGTVYAVDRSGTRLRLPCVRSTKLQPLIAASAGRIPNPAEPAS